MIANDLDYTYIDEYRIDMDSLYLLSYYLELDEKLVIHCPVLCRYVHNFSSEANAIVLVRRNIEDIVRSQNRIGWRWEKLELMRYDRKSGTISKIKYDFWEKCQKNLIVNGYEIRYENLCSHPMWISFSDRKEFLPDQVDLEYSFHFDYESIFPVKVPGGFVYEEGGKITLFLQERNSALSVNETGKIIYELSDGKNSIADISRRLESCFQVEEYGSTENDVVEFIRKLVSKRFVEVCIKRL